MLGDWKIYLGFVLGGYLMLWNMAVGDARWYTPLIWAGTWAILEGIFYLIRTPRRRLQRLASIRKGIVYGLEDANLLKMYGMVPAAVDMITGPHVKELVSDRRAINAYQTTIETRLLGPRVKGGVR